MRKMIGVLFLLLLFNGNLDSSTNVITTNTENIIAINHQIEQYSLPDLPSEH